MSDYDDGFADAEAARWQAEDDRRWEEAIDAHLREREAEDDERRRRQREGR